MNESNIVQETRHSFLRAGTTLDLHGSPEAIKRLIEPPMPSVIVEIATGLEEARFPGGSERNLHVLQMDDTFEVIFLSSEAG